MDYKPKTCPRCKTALLHGNGAFELVKKRGAITAGIVGPESSPGLPIALYSCPKCGYIELYDLKVIGRI
jgi:RNase P subunit RPR2